MKKKKSFTLIWLIAALVILVLIVTPLVMNIIKKARTSADKRSIDAYVRSIELAIASYLLAIGTFPENVLQLTIEYIKYVVDAWNSAEAPAATEARLIILDELSSLGFEWKQTCDTCGLGWAKTENVPTWITNYMYLTSNKYQDSSNLVYTVDNNYQLSYTGITNYVYVVCPVITISKSYIYSNP